MTRIRDLGDGRARLIDSGVDVQVLSLTAPGVQNLEASDARDAASRVNDLIASTVAGGPDRFQVFATLPTPIPLPRRANRSARSNSSTWRAR